MDRRRCCLKTNPLFTSNMKSWLLGIFTDNRGKGWRPLHHLLIFSTTIVTVGQLLSRHS